MPKKLPESIQSLDLGFNRLKELSIHGLPNLGYLELEGNRMSRLRGDKRSLNSRTLRWSNNNFSEIPEVVNPETVTSLYFSKNNLEGTLDLSGFADLWYLDITDNNLDDLVLKDLDELYVAYIWGNPCASDREVIGRIRKELPKCTIHLKWGHTVIGPRESIPYGEYGRKIRKTETRDGEEIIRETTLRFGEVIDERTFTPDELND